MTAVWWTVVTVLVCAILTTATAVMVLLAVDARAQRRHLTARAPRGGRHRAGIAPGTAAQRQAWRAGQIGYPGHTGRPTAPLAVLTLIRPPVAVMPR